MKPLEDYENDAFQEDEFDDAPCQNTTASAVLFDDDEAPIPFKNDAADDEKADEPVLQIVEHIDAEPAHLVVAPDETLAVPVADKEEKKEQTNDKKDEKQDAKKDDKKKDKKKAKKKGKKASKKKAKKEKKKAKKQAAKQLKKEKKAKKKAKKKDKNSKQ